ncbi:MAG TPA: DUF4097 family beta strand repeat-containing protein [Steroidobacteraceae bacterium]|jgi:DUF4097 and DUF4098 domain-containing protein YvlB
MRIVSIITLALLLAAAAARIEAKDFEQRVQADPKGTVEVSNVAGRVNIAGWDRSEVEVTGHLGDDVEHVEVTTSGNRTFVKVVLPRMGSHDGDAELDIQVPKGADLDVSTVSADVAVVGVLGSQSLKTVSGDVRAELAGPRFQGKTVSGDLRVRGAAKASDVHLETVSGDVTLDRGAGDVEAVTTSGDLHLDVDPARSVRIRTISGDLSFAGSLESAATLDAQTVSGDLTLRARAKAGFEYEANTFSGDIENCFGVKAQRVSQFGPGSRLDGKVGDGEAHVHAKSMSGDLTICDH